MKRYRYSATITFRVDDILANDRDEAYDHLNDLATGACSLFLSDPDIAIQTEERNAAWPHPED